MGKAHPSQLLSSVEYSLESAKSWLKDAFIHESSDGSGWGHSKEEQLPSVWGGTLDGVRALVPLGEPARSPYLDDAVTWMKGQQRDDGGFGTREMNYSAAEATSWVVVTLSELGLDGTDAVVKRAVGYLRRCVDSHGGVATTPIDTDQPRTHPAALALWALSLQPSAAMTCNSVIQRLRSSQDPETGGWGVAFGATPNAVTTAQVLHALWAARVSVDADWMERGARFLIERQREDGSWANGYDEWYTEVEPRTPYRTSHFGTSWGLLALSHFPGQWAQYACVAAVDHLTSRQRTSGAWLFEEYDPTEYIWCTAQAAVALVAWKDAQSSAVRGGRSNARAAVAATATVDAIRTMAQWLRTSLLHLAVAGILVFLMRDQVVGVISEVARFLRFDELAIWNNLFSSAIWALLVLALGAIFRRLSRRGPR